MFDQAPSNVKVARQINATPETVFDAYVNPEVGRRLFAGDATWDVTVTSDVRVGGTWQIRTGPHGDPPFVETNVFRQVQRPNRLEFGSVYTMPDGYSFERDVEVTFESMPDGSTLMVMDHRGFPTQELREAFAEALPTVVDKLKKTVEA